MVYWVNTLPPVYLEGYKSWEKWCAFGQKIVIAFVFQKIVDWEMKETVMTSLMGSAHRHESGIIQLYKF